MNITLLFESLFLLVLVLVSIPVLVFFIQVVISLPGYRSRAVPDVRRPSIAILVPAHNEGGGIVATLHSIREQLIAGDRLLVVADNCSDDTASVAREAGAEVVERFDTSRRGKGFALDFGMRHLDSSAPEVVIIVDADCLLSAGTLDRLSRMCMSTGRPIQAKYMMHSTGEAGVKTKIAEFAWAVKSVARPLGFLRLGLPCQLMGTGMAFPWQVIRRVDLASGHIVEDLKLGLDLARIGYAPMFCPEALVTSEFAKSAEGAQSQRTRWEHGHLSMILAAPRLLLASLTTGNKDLFALVFDMCVPPLALLTIVVAGFCLAGMAAWAGTGEFMPWGMAIAVAVVISVAVLLSWLRVGREILSFGNLAYAPIYALKKIPMYLKFIVRRQVEWVRSKRDED